MNAVDAGNQRDVPGPRRLPTAGEQIELHRAYIEHSPLAIMVVDSSGRYLEVNPAACRISGYDESELLHMSLVDLLAEESLEAGRRHFALVQEQGQAGGELCWARKDGTKRWSTCDAVKLSADRYLAFCVDLTRRRQAEEALQRSQAELRTIYDHAPQMMCVLDAERRVVYLNQAMSAFIGQSEETLRGNRACGILGCINALDDPRGCGYGPNCECCPLRRAILDTLQTATNHRGIDYRARLDLGDRCQDVAFVASTAIIQSNDQRRLLLCMEDVTEQRKAGERTRVLAELLDASPTSTTVHDADGNFLYANRKTFTLHGCSEQDFLATNLHQLDVPGSAKFIDDRIQTIAKQGEASFEVEHYRKDGTTIPLHVDTKLARWGGQSVFLSVATDVSDLKRTEQAVRERETILRGILDAVGESVFLMDTQGMIVTCNQTTANRLGRTPEDLVGHSIYDFIPAEVAQSRRTRIEQVIRSGKWVRFEDQRDGRWFEHTAYPVLDDTGKVAKIAIFGRDISDRRQNELLLQQATERLELAKEATGAGVWDWDILGGNITWSPEMFTLFGLNASEATASFEAWNAALHPDDLTVAHNRIEQAIQDRAPLRSEYRVVHPDGQVHWILALGKTIYAADGQAARMTGVCLDITESKLAEYTLRQSEEKLRIALDAAEMGTWIYTFDSQMCEYDERAQRLYGLSGPLFHHDEQGVRGIVHPDDVKNMWQAVQHACHDTSAGRYQAEYRIRRLEGGWRWLGVWGQIEFSETSTDRRPVRMVGASRDITPRKQAEEQLELHSLVLNQIHDKVTITDLDGIITYVNDAECQAMKKSLESLVGQSVIVAYGDDPQRGATQDDIIRTTLADEEWRGEVVNRAADGTDVVVDCRTCLVKAADGRPIAMCGIATDISERKKIEESLRANEEFRTNILNALSAHIAVLDQQGTIFAVNAAWERFARENSEAPAASTGVGVNYLDVCRAAPGQYQQEAQAAVDGIVSVLQGRQSRFWMEYACHSPDARRWFLMQVTPLSTRAGGVIVSHEDISERKRAEEEKLEIERRLLHAQKLESLGVLAGGIAHDFNNILAGIMGYADLAKVRLPESEPAREDIDVIKKAVQRAADLTRQMLAYSGVGKCVVESVNITQMLEDMRKLLDVSVSKKAVLNYRLAEQLPAIQADGSQIHQVILNLVVNASDALTDHNGVIAISTDKIQCRAADFADVACGADLPAGPYIMLEVADTGCGMDKQTLKRIFDPFFTTKFTGRGLGLAAVHGIVRGHKGAIRVVSQPGQGTTFQVLFPASDTPAPTPLAAAVASPWRSSGMILVVDDEEIIRDSARRIIERVGFSVLTACDGEEAIELYQRHHDDIACVLLDLTMPKMNGEETLLAMRRIHPQVRAILTTGYSEEGTSGRFADLGLAGFLQKPYQLDAMVATLQKVLAVGVANASGSTKIDQRGPTN